jgi:hypothetical protein
MEKQKELLQLPATIESIASRADGTYKVAVGTQELTDDQALSVVKLNRKMGWFVFKENPLEKADIIDIPELTPEFKTDKTPSKRLRGVLYVLWEQKYKSQGVEFDDFYKKQMEKIITWAKEKLD